MEIEGSVALVTGADRGLGRVFVRELVGRGVARVYGAARNPAAVTEPGVTSIALDITDPARVAEVETHANHRGSPPTAKGPIAPR